MRAARTLVSALCILGGVVLIASWAVSSVVVDAMEEGSALAGVTERALESPQVRSAIAAQVADHAVAALADQGVEATGPAAREAIERASAAAVASPAFEAAVLAETRSAHAQFVDALTDEQRTPEPLVLSVDVSDTVNARIDDAGVVGEALPDVSVAAVDIPVLSTERFETTRVTYERIQWIQGWGLWAGLALLAGGILVSHRRRWFVAKVLLALGAGCLGFAAAMAILGPEAMMALLPGGDGNPLATAWREVITAATAPAVMERVLWLGGIALAAAAVFMLIGAVARGRRH